MAALMDHQDGDQLVGSVLRQRKPITSEITEQSTANDTDDKDKKEITWGKTASGQGQCIKHHKGGPKAHHTSLQSPCNAFLRTHYRYYPSPLFLDPLDFCVTHRSAYHILPTRQPPDYTISLLLAVLYILARMLRLGFRLGSPTAE
jgi:hypothetical protein